MADQTTDFSASGVVNQTPAISSEGLLPQLVQHLRQNRTALREEWARRITEAELLTAMS
ncbi:MAG: anti-anti-sigma factor, partial [Mycobacterium sp.]